MKKNHTDIRGECIGEKSGGFLKIIAVFALVWAIILAVSIIFLMQAQGIFIVLVIASAIVIALCAFELVRYVRTPKQTVLKGEDKICFWSGGKWVKLTFDDIDEARTNGQWANSYVSLRSMLDRGVVRIFDKHANMYRVKYLYDAEGVRRAINQCAVPQNDSTDNTINTVNAK